MSDSAGSSSSIPQWLAAFGDALDRGDTQAAADLFAPECYWRDLVSFTWNIKTMEGREAIRKMLDTPARVHQAFRLGDTRR